MQTGFLNEIFHKIAYIVTYVNEAKLQGNERQIIVIGQFLNFQTCCRCPVFKLASPVISLFVDHDVCLALL